MTSRFFTINFSIKIHLCQFTDPLTKTTLPADSNVTIHFYKKITLVQPALEQKFTPSAQQLIKTGTPPLTSQAKNAPTSIHQQNYKLELVKYFNCGNYISVTPSPPGQPTYIHCPKCDQDGTM